MGGKISITCDWCSWPVSRNEDDIYDLSGVYDTYDSDDITSSIKSLGMVSNKSKMNKLFRITCAGGSRWKTQKLQLNHFKF